jgi:cell division protein YceG involved in septum cleavage
VVLIQRGQSLREVGEELERVGLMRGTLGFQVLARLMRLDRHIKAGQYSFRLGITIPALLRSLGAA